jgi:hypothetical protein
MRKICLALAILVLSPSAFCGDSSGTVGSYLVYRYGKLFFNAGPATSRPACSPGNEWAVDLVGPDAAAGRAMLATIIAAHISGKTVYVHGKGVCDVWGDRETVDYVVVSQ